MNRRPTRPLNTKKSKGFGNMAGPGVKLVPLSGDLSEKLYGNNIQGDLLSDVDEQTKELANDHRARYATVHDTDPIPMSSRKSVAPSPSGRVVKKK